MDALLTALLACLIVEMGDRCQLLSLALAVRHRPQGAVIGGILIAAFANAIIAAAAGGFLAPMLGLDARKLFFGLALAMAGTGLLTAVKRPDLLTGWRIGALPTSALGLFILGFGNGAQFLALAISVRTADPIFSAIGSGLGVSLACVPVVLLRQHFFAALPLKWIRRVGGILFVGLGAGLSLSAIGLM
jgi:putative Ca2+/H+ antiporter (TMEM165/GDT1 family)